MLMKISKTFDKIRVFLDDIHIPVLDISLWGLLEIYVGGLFKNQIIKQAASISWNFFFSLFPFILFLLSILPYFPHYNEVYDYIFNVFLPRILPDNIQEDVTIYIEDTITPKIMEISKWTILLVLFFATTGTYSMIHGFNENTDDQRGFLKEYIMAFFITLAFTSAIILTILGIYYGELVLGLLMPEYRDNWLAHNLTSIISYISFPIFYAGVLSLFYWVGTVRMTKFIQVIPGTILTTILFMITTYIFAIYVGKFARYNMLYGSIGSVILLMIWVEVNVALILFGNELNLAIKKIHSEKIRRNSICL